MSTVTPFSSVTEFINILQTRKWKFYSLVVSNPPVVSIISSFFNAHQYFEATYESIINQTFQNFEWIIVDDCSTEPEAIALFQSLTARCAKIKTLTHQTNKGISAGRNTAIARATGKYLFFIDLDDLLDPTCIEKCVLFLETHPKFSFVNSYSVGFQAQDYWWNHSFDKPSQFIQQNWVTGRLLYRKSDFDCLGGFDEHLRFYEDWERWLKAITNHQKGWTIPEYLDCYRRLNYGLLATSRKNIDEEKRVNELIKARYQSFFTNDTLTDIKIKRIGFNVNEIKSKIAITNPLKRSNTDKNILCFFPHLEIGGADKFNLDLVTLLAERGYNITIATTLKSDHPWQKHFYIVTPDIFHLPNFLEDNQWLAFTKYIIESRQIDIILISNCYTAYYFLPLLKQEFPNITFVDFTHTSDSGWRGVGYPRLSVQFSQFLDCQIVTSKYLAEFYQEINPRSRDNLKICYTNIDTNKWVNNSNKRQQLRSKLGIADNTVVLLFPARIVKQKRPLFLVDIIKQLTNHFLPISAIVLGSGDLLSEMQLKVSQLGLDSYFHILPPVAPEEMLDFYSAADILLLPSEYEGISISIYEAMSMQLPVVATDVGGQTELVTPETGFLVAKGDGDAREVQEYLEILLALIQNPQLRQQVGCQARQRVVESFGLTKMADRMEEIFAEAIARSQSVSKRSAPAKLIALSQTKPKPETNLELAEEMLLIALEYLHQESALSNLWQEKGLLEQERNQFQQEKYQLERENNQLQQEKYQLEQERHELAWKKQAMETSKFWKLRKSWLKLKRLLRLTQEEEI